jgi:hypothetical protein
MTTADRVLTGAASADSDGAGRADSPSKREGSMKHSPLAKVAVGLAAVAIVLSVVTLVTRPPGQNPWKYQLSNPHGEGVQVEGTPHSTTNLQTWLDSKGIPIAAIGQVGGLKVFGDNIAVNAPGNVYRSSVVLHDTGGVTLSANGPTLYGGTSAPSMKCKTGDYYFRKSTVPGQRVYECYAGYWGPIL